jgi:hypothetical protein
VPAGGNAELSINYRQKDHRPAIGSTKLRGVDKSVVLPSRETCYLSHILSLVFPVQCLHPSASSEHEIQIIVSHMSAARKKGLAWSCWPATNGAANQSFSSSSSSRVVVRKTLAPIER